MSESRYRLEKSISPVISPKTIDDFHEQQANGFCNGQEKQKEVCCGYTLYKIEEMLEYLRFNPFITYGYRGQTNIKGCCESLLFFHNETVNIYTHGIAGILMLFWIPYASISSIYANFPLYILHYIGCMSPFIGSTIYHLFMCHNSGVLTYDRLLKFDMSGIWAINTFGGITSIKATLFCYPILKNSFFMIYIITAFVILYSVLTAKNVKERFQALLLFGIFRYAVLTARGLMLHYNFAAGDSRAIIYYILMDLAALIGGILNTTRFPERCIPGKLDFCFNSHNIMHVVVSFCPVLLHWGTMLDFDWMGNYQCSL